MTWTGVPGMHWADLLSKFQLRMISGGRPSIVVLHLGGNDLASESLVSLKNNIISDITYMAGVLPNTRFIWFDILPRLRWRAVSLACDKELDLKRKRVNRFGRGAVCQYTKFGGFIGSNIDRHTPGFYCSDGVHLSEVGMNMYLMTLKEALTKFLESTQFVKYIEERV